MHGPRLILVLAHLEHLVEAHHVFLITQATERNLGTLLKFGSGVELVEISPASVHQRADTNLGDSV